MRKPGMIAILVGALLATPLAIAKQAQPGDTPWTLVSADTTLVVSEAPPTYGGPGIAMSTTISHGTSAHALKALVSVDNDLGTPLVKLADDAYTHRYASNGLDTGALTTNGLLDNPATQGMSREVPRSERSVPAILMGETKADELTGIGARAPG